jgi:urease accessory protein UreE
MKPVPSLSGSQRNNAKQQSSDAKAPRLRLKRYGLRKSKRAGTLEEGAALHVKFFDKPNTNDGEDLSSPYKSRIAGSIKIS